MEPTQTPERPVEQDPVEDERISPAFVRWIPIFVPLSAAIIVLGTFVIYSEILTRG